MNRAARYGAYLGTLLLGVSCAPEVQSPITSDKLPETEYVQVPPGSLTSAITGLAWDPEVLFINLARCGKTCPIPPALLEDNPLYLRSAVRGAVMAAFDPTLGRPAVEPVPTNDMGLFWMEGVPSRTTVPYFLTTLPTPGTHVTSAPIASPPLPVVDIASGGYLPTVALRPVVTHNPLCANLEAGSLSTVGILDAVARFLSFTGTSTTVADFVDPTKFANVVVFWNFQPGNPVIRGPAENTTVEASAGQVLNLTWVPPEVPGVPYGPPLELRSPRGFMVVDAPVSPLGVSVVLLRQGPDVPQVVKYAVKDPYVAPTDSSAPVDTTRPWIFPPFEAPPTPTVVNFAGNQLWRVDQPNGPANPVPPLICLPLQP